ncbi:MAG: hypothetical protein IT464_12695 [Planctomycetes bacterium]|nr:hypothetical protein [Planctomycetota bacterium]
MSDESLHFVACFLLTFLMWGASFWATWRMHPVLRYFLTLGLGAFVALGMGVAKELADTEASQSDLMFDLYGTLTSLAVCAVLSGIALWSEETTVVNTRGAA